MKLEAMIDAAVTTFKHTLSETCKDFDTEVLTPALSEQVMGSLSLALSCAGVSGLRTFLESYECDAPSVSINEKTYRFKQASEKTFLTPFGRMELTRNLYQSDAGGPCYIPLDERWGMTGEFATLEVREAVLFSCAHITPDETVDVLNKCARFEISCTAVKHIVKATGDFIEAQDEQINQEIRVEERVPCETSVFVASLDGVNVRLRVPGKKRGRPRKRPGADKEEETPSAYKNAVVGSLSFYGACSTDEDTPERLLSRYCAQMPQEGAPTLKKRFCDEVDHMEEHLPDGTIKILLFDGARGLWNYVEKDKRFEDYEMLIDFYHTTEHLSKAAELLFGKGTENATIWYDTYYDKLLKEQGATARVVRSITYHLNQKKRSKKREEDIVRERTFFLRNQNKMMYADFKARGLPIGSGPVEAACKTIVKTRLGRSGMRWSWHGGQSILQLRTYVKSNRWDAFWQAYKTRRIKPIEYQDLHWVA